MNPILRFLGGISTGGWLAILLLAVVSSAIAGGLNYIDNLKSDLERAYLTADSLEAQNDTTRLVYSDSIHVYQRRIIQTEQENDELDRALGAQRALNARLSLRVDSLTLEASSSVTEAADTLKMHFRRDTVPYTIEADIVVPPEDPETNVRPDASAVFRVSLDVLPLSALIGCSPTEGTFNTATLNIITPEWANVNIVSVAQEPRVCNPNLVTLDTGRFWEKPSFYVPASIVTLGLILILN